MVIAEQVASGAVAGAGTPRCEVLNVTMVVKGEPISDGIALGHIVLHEPRVVVTNLLIDRPGRRARSGSKPRTAALARRLDDMMRHEAVGQGRRTS